VRSRARLRCQLLEGTAVAADEGSADWLYQYQWEPAPAADAEQSAIAPHSALLAADLQKAADEWASASGWARYYDVVEPKLNQLAVRLAADALRSIGWQPDAGRRSRPSGLHPAQPPSHVVSWSCSRRKSCRRRTRRVSPRGSSRRACLCDRCRADAALWRRARWYFARRR
jgi:hypothetical protein